MRERRCATQGCSGTLPVHVGSHCPRCGGTQFVPPRKRGRKVAVLLVLAVAVAVSLMYVKSHRALNLTPERQRLIQAYDVASRMTLPTARDEAYADVVGRALREHDFEYACEVSGDMTMPTPKDKCLRDIVEEALSAHQNAWASRAAEEMVMPTARDAALKRIMEGAVASQSGPEQQ